MSLANHGRLHADGLFSNIVIKSGFEKGAGTPLDVPAADLVVNGVDQEGTVSSSCFINSSLETSLSVTLDWLTMCSTTLASKRGARTEASAS